VLDWAKPGLHRGPVFLPPRRTVSKTSPRNLTRNVDNGYPVCYNVDVGDDNEGGGRGGRQERRPGGAASLLQGR